MGSVPARLGDPILSQTYVRPRPNATPGQEERTFPPVAPGPNSAPALTFRHPCGPEESIVRPAERPAPGGPKGPAAARAGPVIGRATALARPLIPHPTAETTGAFAAAVSRRPAARGPGFLPPEWGGS